MLLKINPQGSIRSDATNLDLVPLTGKTGGTNTKNNAYYGSADCSGNTMPTGVNPSGDVYQLCKDWGIVSADVILWDQTPGWPTLSHIPRSLSNQTSADIYQRYYIFPFYYRGVTDGSPIVCFTTAPPRDYYLPLSSTQPSCQWSRLTPETAVVTRLGQRWVRTNTSSSSTFLLTLLFSEPDRYGQF